MINKANKQFKHILDFNHHEDEESSKKAIA